MPLFNSLRTTLTGSMIAMAVLAVGLVGSLWIAQEYSKFETESARLREEYVEQQRALIKRRRSTGWSTTLSTSGPPPKPR